MNRINGEEGKNAHGALHGQQVGDSEEHDPELTVRLDGTEVKFTSTLDSQPLYEWTGPAAARGEDPKWTTKTPPGSFALGAFDADWVVYAVKVKRLDAGK